MGSLRDRQVEAIKAMLTLDSNGNSKNNNVEPSWKVLVYDKTGKSLLYPHFKLFEQVNLYQSR